MSSSGCWQWGNPPQCGALAMVTTCLVTCVLPTKGLQETRHFPLPVAASCCVEAALEERQVQWILWIPLIALEVFPAKFRKPSSSYEDVETRSSNDGSPRINSGCSFHVSGTAHLDAQVTFLVIHSGLSEVAEEKCLRNHGLAHPRTSQVCPGYTSNPAPSWDGWSDVKRWFICIRRQISCQQVVGAERGLK